MSIIKYKTLFGVLSILLCITLQQSICQAKYVIETTIVAVQLNIDRSKPEGIINYSTINEKVLVTIKLSEPIQEIDEWSFSEDGLVITKEYEQNIVDNVTIVDLAGNANILEIKTTPIEEDLQELNNLENLGKN